MKRPNNFFGKFFRGANREIECHAKTMVYPNSRIIGEMKAVKKMIPRWGSNI